MNNYVDWWLEKFRDSEDCDIHFSGIDLHIKKRVFNPSNDLTHSTQIILNHLPNLEGKSVLDIGTGCGILSIIAHKNGASRVVAIDNDSTAIHCALDNFKNLNLDKKITIRQKDITDLGHERFDIVLANLPIRIDSDRGRIYDTLIKKLKDILTDEGRAYLTHASFSNTELFEKRITKSNLTFKKTKEKKFKINWFLYKIENSKITN